MAGITNSAFRRLCREYGGGMYVAEMVTSRALVERTPESLRIISHDEDEKVRSVQLYGVDPVTVGAAVRMLVEEDRADTSTSTSAARCLRSPGAVAARPCLGRSTSSPPLSRQRSRKRPRAIFP